MLYKMSGHVAGSLLLIMEETKSHCKNSSGYCYESMIDLKISKRFNFYYLNYRFISKGSNSTYPVNIKI